MLREALPWKSTRHDSRAVDIGEGAPKDISEEDGEIPLEEEDKTDSFKERTRRSFGLEIPGDTRARGTDEEGPQ